MAGRYCIRQLAQAEGADDNAVELPETVGEAWDGRAGPAVLGSVNAEGKASLANVNSVWKLNEQPFVIADNYFHKTRANFKAGSAGSILFLTKARKSYQVKGAIWYHTDGEVCETIRRWNADMDPKRSRVRAAVLHVEEIHGGGERLA